MLRFRLLGVDFRVSFWFFAVAGLFAALERGGMLWWTLPPVLAHELGHLLAIAACGTRPTAVILGAAGAQIRRPEQFSLTTGAEVAVCLGGVAANAAFALGLYFFAPESFNTMLLVAANAAVAIFNLLPVGNLDGGALTKIIARRFFLPRAAFVVSRFVSFAVLVPLFAAAIFLLMRGENFTLLLMCVYLAVVVIAQE